MSGAENTVTNPVLAGGLAIVGLLGVAGALLPADLLRSNSADMAVELLEQAAVQADDAPVQEHAATAEGPVFKPVELQSISDADQPPLADGAASEAGSSQGASDQANVSEQAVTALAPVSPDAAQATLPSTAEQESSLQGESPRFEAGSHRPAPAWNWQPQAYPPPPAPQPYATPQPYAPHYPPQYYGHPQWGAPQH